VFRHHGDADKNNLCRKDREAVICPFAGISGNN